MHLKSCICWSKPLPHVLSQPDTNQMCGEGQYSAGITLKHDACTSSQCQYFRKNSGGAIFSGNNTDDVIISIFTVFVALRSDRDDNCSHSNAAMH